MDRPLRRWFLRHVICWLTLAGFVVYWQGPHYVRAVRPDFFPSGYIFFLPDFFQEWASARNRLEGLPIYSPHRETVERYLGMKPNPADPCFIEYNAHPPPAVLLGLPFAGLDFADAFRAWNLLSLLALAAGAWLIVRELELPFVGWELLPVVVVLLPCQPFWHQMIHGQLNLLLFLLLTGTWVAARRGHPGMAGTFLGTATAIKLFPAFLFLYFLLRRQWWALVSGAATLFVWGGLAVVVLGPQAYQDYCREALPSAALYRSDWHNLSLTGISCKLFDTRKRIPPVEIRPWIESPPLAFAGMVLTGLAVGGALALLIPHLRPGRETDRGFGLTIIGMLLVSPITWDHYLLLLALPIPVLWQRLPRGGAGREVLGPLLAILWLNPEQVMEHVMLLVGASRVPERGEWTTTPVETLTALSVPCYALAGIFVLGILSAREGLEGNATAALTVPSAPSSDTAPRAPTGVCPPGEAPPVASPPRTARL
ncbi:MAG: DUF2029 domain-containing protein [Planctomycetes bacterium]|nr:DUF2029 domain-containing protein [Planctomycetota bacterium]